MVIASHRFIHHFNERNNFQRSRNFDVRAWNKIAYENFQVAGSRSLLNHGVAAAVVVVKAITI